MGTRVTMLSFENPSAIRRKSIGALKNMSDRTRRTQPLGDPIELLDGLMFGTLAKYLRRRRINQDIVREIDVCPSEYVYVR